jgi:acyl carrier protein
MTPTETAIHEFLTKEVFYDQDLTGLVPGESLLERGLLDSLAILRIVSFCEEQFAITLPDDEVIPDHFESIQAIAALVERVRGGR